MENYNIFTSMNRQAQTFLCGTETYIKVFICWKITTLLNTLLKHL